LGICGIYGSGSVLIKNNLVWGNTSPSNLQVSGALNVTYSLIQGGYPGAGNIDSNPLFADTNYILQSSSPCIDRGDSSTIYNDLPDAGNPSNAKYPSRGTVRNDIGAYGGPMATLLSNQLIGIQITGATVPDKFNLYQNYPNPFNPVTRIKFDIPQSGFVTLAVYDILGKEVSLLVNQYMVEGSYTVDLNASVLSSGIYFYTLSSGSYVSTKKMVLTK
jgi:hypothetical protein